MLLPAWPAIVRLPRAFVAPTVPPNNTFPLLLIIVSASVPAVPLTVEPKLMALLVLAVRVVLAARTTAAEYVCVPLVVIVPARVLTPVTVKADVFVEVVIAAPDAIVSEARVTVPEYCRSSVPLEPIETTLAPGTPALVTASLPALILVVPVYVFVPVKVSVPLPALVRLKTSVPLA